MTGNDIRHLTKPAINLRCIGGRAHVEGNVIATGPVSSLTPRPEAIRVVNIGSYVIVHNSIEVQWPPDGTVFGPLSTRAAGDSHCLSPSWWLVRVYRGDSSARSLPGRFYPTPIIWPQREGHGSRIGLFWA